jgi:hypothetical protein
LQFQRLIGRRRRLLQQQYYFPARRHKQKSMSRLLLFHLYFQPYLPL